MHLRKWRKRVKGRTEEYWALVESYRTDRGPRQRIVAYLGDVEEAAREGVAQAARGVRTHQLRLEEAEAPEWVQVDVKRLRVERLGQLFDLEYDLLLYDVTSTYFEGLAEGNPQAQRGYSRDHRPDCKQVCIALVVARGGMPLGYQVFAGDRNDVTTVKEIVEYIEGQYGAADRIWVMDRGMVSEETVAFLREESRRYILGTPKSSLRRFEQPLLEEDWETVREGLEVKLCPSSEGEETFILCRSAARREKEQAMPVPDGAHEAPSDPVAQAGTDTAQAPQNARGVVRKPTVRSPRRGISGVSSLKLRNLG